MERITTPAGITYSYEKSGSGPTLVLVHGSLNRAHTGWMLVRPLLEPQFTLYAVNRRGRGETTATEGQSIPDEADDLIALLGKIGGPVFVLGHSFGAHVALAAAGRAPELVRKLVLYEPPASREMTSVGLSRLQELIAGGEDAEMVEEFLRNVVHVPAEQVDALKTTPFWPLLVADAQNSVREWPALDRLDFKPEAYASLTMPVLLLTGSESPPGQYYTDELAAVVPDARVVIFPGQGHAATATAPQMFVDTVAEFLLGTPVAGRQAD